jgi:hypothetical protein
MTAATCEAVANVPLRRYLRARIGSAPSAVDGTPVGGWISTLTGLLIFAIVRYERPRFVIETGVGAGGTSAFILKALHDNRRGHLVSIDLPGNDASVYPALGKPHHIQVPDRWETGWLVPPRLRDRWTLILGDSREELPSLLERHPEEVDVFLHDSLHTDEHVRFELETVASRLTDGAVVMADDVDASWTLAFLSVCSERKWRYHRCSAGLGVART